MPRKLVEETKKRVEAEIGHPLRELTNDQMLEPLQEHSKQVVEEASENGATSDVKELAADYITHLVLDEHGAFRDN